MSKPCKQCGGTGQKCHFKGESRFLLSWEECPACCGTGYEIETSESDQDSIEKTAAEDSTSSDAE